MQKRMGRAICGIAVLVGLCLAGSMPAGAADESIVELNSSETMQSLLEQQVGKRVKINLCSGQDVEGKVAKFCSPDVQLTALSSMEWFDATVKLHDVAAVIVRARSKYSYKTGE